jgi:hypothetical protein
MRGVINGQLSRQLNLIQTPERFFSPPSRKINFFQKVTFFQARLRATQKPHSHHENTTTSPQKTIQKTHAFPKPPSKNALKPAQISSQPTPELSCKKT